MPRDPGYSRCAYCGAQLHLHSKTQNDTHDACVRWRRHHEIKCCVKSPLERRVWALKYAMNQPSISGITVDLGHPGLCWDESLFESDTDVIELLTSFIHND